MRNLLKIEELAMFALALAAYAALDLPWWWFAALLFTPDLGMVGYLAGPRVGSVTFNLFHHKALAIGLYLLGSYFASQPGLIAGIIIFAHSSVDRVLGYGLKYSDSFQHTHLGPIGRATR